MVKPAGAPLDARALRRRVLVWAVMVAALGWTVAYAAGQGDSDVPEFVYVNF